jgi:hypothetical protein
MATRRLGTHLLMPQLYLVPPGPPAAAEPGAGERPAVRS